MPQQTGDAIPQPEELAGILTGALLLAVLTGEALLKTFSARHSRGSVVKSPPADQVNPTA